MAKKRKKKSNGKRHNLSKKELLQKNAKQNLSEKIDKIYHNKVNLKTEMSCKCHCCQVAMPQMNYSEFINIVQHVWDNFDKEYKKNLICTSIEYFFRNEFDKWGISSLVKPCMFLGEKGLCNIYDQRPLSCRMFGQWPQDMYEERVQRFEDIYKEHGLTREDLPLHKQCASVKRVDDSVEINKDIIEELFEDLNNLDKKIGDYTDLQVENKENYRTFHDWLLLKIFGEDWLSKLTTFMLAADKPTIEEQLSYIVEAVGDNDELLDITKGL